MEGNKFDPMTGQPIVGDAATEAVSEAGSAAETTAAAASNATQQAEEIVNNVNDLKEQAVSYDPVAGESVVSTPEKKKGAGKLIAIIAAAVAVVAAIVCLVIFVILPMFGKPITKIEKAIENTFSQLNKGDNLLFTALSPAGLEKSDTMTLSFEGEVEDFGSASIDLIKTKDAFQLCAGVDASEVLDIPYIDAQFLYDKDSISVASSLLNNQYVYYYTEDLDEDSFLYELFEEMESEGLDADTVNGILKDYYNTLTDYESLNKANEELIEEIKEHFRDLDVEKTDSAEFEINGKDVKCKGYTVTITEKDLKKALDSYTKAMKGTFEKSMGTLLEVADMDAEELMDEAFGEAYDAIEDMEDIDIDFFIYKNQLAAIEIEVDGEKLSIQFQGGDYRAQNILMKVDGSKLEITGSKDGNVEKAAIKADKEEIFSYEFDSKKGDLSFVINDGYDEYEIEGINIKSKDDELVIALNEMDLEGVILDGSLTVKKAAKLKEMSGDEFSLNDATEDDLEEAFEDESAALEELGGLEGLFGGSYDYDDDWDDYDWDDFDWEEEDWEDDDYDW